MIRAAIADGAGRITGETVKSYRQLLGFDTVPLGDVLVGAGPDVVARLVDP